MDLACAQKLPIIGEFVSHIRKGQPVEVVKDTLRLIVAAVAIVALGVFPSLNTCAVKLPYIGTYIAQGISKFNLLSPAARHAAVGVVSLPALALAGGVYFIASGVSALAQATMAMSVVGRLDIAAKLLTGAMLLHKYRMFDVGALEMAK